MAEALGALADLTEGPVSGLRLLRVICNCGYRASKALFWPPYAQGIHETHIHACKQNTYRNKVKINKCLLKT